QVKAKDWLALTGPGALPNIAKSSQKSAFCSARFTGKIMKSIAGLPMGMPRVPSRTRRGRMKDYHINVFYSEVDNCYVADIPDLKFCSAFGATPEEAVREVQI